MIREEHPEFDFEHDLPAGVESFALHWLAKRWKVSLQHVFNLVRSGEIPVAVDLRNSNSSRSCIRAPRAAVVAFLNRRKDLTAIEESSPAPGPRTPRRPKSQAPSSKHQRKNGKRR
jgi:hypothetical protein